MALAGLAVSPPAWPEPAVPPQALLTAHLPHPQQGGGEGQHGEQEQCCQDQAEDKEGHVQRGPCPRGRGTLLS